MSLINDNNKDNTESSNVQQPTPLFLAYLSVTGSVASILGLVIVLVQAASFRYGLAPQHVVWRYLLFGICFVAAGGIATYTYYDCRDHIRKEGTVKRKIVRTTCSLMLGTLLSAIALDGAFSALYWTPWLLSGLSPSLIKALIEY